MNSGFPAARPALWSLTLLPLLLAGCGSGNKSAAPGNPNSPSTPGTATSTSFSVKSITPAAGATGVALNTTIQIVFSAPANAATVNSTDIQVTDPNSVAGTVTYNASTDTATFTPSSPLSANSTYTIRVSGVTGSDGTAMASVFTSSFATASSSSGKGIGSANLTVLHTFEDTDGANPNAALIEDATGNLYSTTQYGGNYQSGTVFELTSSGSLSLLHQFGYPSTDGSRPQAPLFADLKGNLYGTTYVGGNNCEDFGQIQCGTVFELDRSGKETILHTFGTQANDGANPASGLIADSAGNFYGTTLFPSTGSVAYQLSSTGAFTVLHTFTGGNDGAAIYGPLVMDASGVLWGTTSAGGGSTACNGGCGVVFKLQHTASGWTETVTHSFSGGKDGGVPYAGLTYDSARKVFYGATLVGGNTSGCKYLGNTTGCGVLFEFDATGTQETVLHNFSGGADGGEPVANLLLDSSGNLLGTTTLGGDLSCTSYGCGTVFSVDPTGQFTTLYTFTGGADGGVPHGALLQDRYNPSIYYGTTTIGGDSKCQTQYGGGPGCGIIFKLTR